jgi:hypothetical protein
MPLVVVAIMTFARAAAGGASSHHRKAVCSTARPRRVVTLNLDAVLVRREHADKHDAMRAAQLKLAAILVVLAASFASDDAIVIWMAFFYFLPVIMADIRQHRNEASIAVVNLFLGWTLVGWVVALAWALSADKPTLQQQT